MAAAAWRATSEQQTGVPQILTSLKLPLITPRNALRADGGNYMEYNKKTNELVFYMCDSFAAQIFDSCKNLYRESLPLP